MSEEIERIIDNLEGCVGMFDYLLTPEDNNLLVLHIRELQQENQLLKEENQMLKLTIEKLTKTPYVYEIRGGKNE